MQKHSNKREEEKIKELLREYSAKGYRVVVEPSQNELPEFMKPLGFHPDMIVYGEEESFVIEVKTSQTIRDTKEFTHIADQIRKQKGWDFMLVLTNPKSVAIAKEKGALPGSAHAFNQFQETEALLRAGKQGQFNNAALLVAWAGLEAAMRYSLSSLYHKEQPVTPQTLVRNSAIYGIISRNDANIIESIMKIRNSIAHGYEGLKVTEDDIREIINIGRGLLTETRSQLAPSIEFIKCPNCGRTSAGEVSTIFYIYECIKCGRHFCSQCGGDRCPDCASKDRRDAGYVKG